MAAKKSAASSGKSNGAPRGSELVELAIAEIVAAGGALPSSLTIESPKKTTPVPLAEAQIAELTLADGSPLPESVARWLAFDSAWLPLSIDPKTKRLRSMKFSALLAERMPEAAEIFASIEDQLFPGDCYPLLTPTICNESAIIFMYGGAKNVKADAHGDLPVLGIDFQDEAMVGVFGAGFDVYLGRLLSVVPSISYALGEGPPGYEEASKSAFERLVGEQGMDSSYEYTLAFSCLA
jgi:hypothetical protein